MPCQSGEKGGGVLRIKEVDRVEIGGYFFLFKVGMWKVRLEVDDCWCDL